MKVLALDGHPAPGRLLGHLLDTYLQALPPGASVTRIAVRDLSFDPVLREGYAGAQPLEPDLMRVCDAIAACDHLVVAFPLWWGAEPAALKGLLDRVVLPGFAFKYRRESPFWDRLLAGRSADVIVTMDTPPWYLRLVYGDPVMKRWRKQVLGFCGFSPIRVFRLGATRRGGAAKKIGQWRELLKDAAQSAASLRRSPKSAAQISAQAYAAAVADRLS